MNGKFLSFTSKPTTSHALQGRGGTRAPIPTFDKLTHELLMIDDKNLTKAPDILASKSIRFAHGSLPIHA